MRLFHASTASLSASLRASVPLRRRPDRCAVNRLAWLGSHAREDRRAARDRKPLGIAVDDVPDTTEAMQPPEVWSASTLSGEHRAARSVIRLWNAMASSTR